MDPPSTYECVEPLDVLLDDLQSSWAARSIRNGDPHVKEFIEAPPAPDFHWWHEGGVPRPTLDSPICASYHISGIPNEGISYGDAGDHRTGHCTDLSIFEPSEEDSKKADLWGPHLEALRDRGWRMAYTDGSKADELAASGIFSEGPCGTRERSYGGYLGGYASIADAERHAMALALGQEPGNVALLCYSRAAISTAHRLAAGGTPRSGIEKAIKDQLTRTDREVGVAWTRAHIGIPGNEKADRQAELERLHGEAWGSPNVATHEGLKEVRKARRKATRSEPGFGRNRTDWGKHAQAAYTWTRTNRGPQKSWLHHIGKTTDPSCPCGHPSQDGDHLVFHCPRLEEQRRRLLPAERTWESLDNPHWVTEARRDGREQEKTEGTETFFQDLYWFLKRSIEGEGEELD